MDTILNFIPARLTGFLMIFASIILRKNWKESRRILIRDQKNTESPNAGWTLSAMAGALGIQLEKPGFYIIGDNDELSPQHIIEALQIMLVTTFLFAVLVVLPLLAIKSFVIFGFLII
jgi:adenosylcobinamide-phosphate synthase